MAVAANFSPATGLLKVVGDSLDDTIVVSRDAAGNILVNGGDVPISGGTPTIANTTKIEVLGQGGIDTILLDDTNGALPPTEVLAGGAGDAATGGSGADQLLGQSGDDTLLGRGGSDELAGGDNNDVLTGGDGDDEVFGEAGDDRLIWNSGDDSDLLEGGDGSDTVEVNGSNGAETFAITPGFGLRVQLDRVSPGPATLDIGSSELLVLNARGGDDVITGASGLGIRIDLAIDAGDGNDTIISGDGDDVLSGGDGNDTVTGNQGEDTAFLGAGDDKFVWDIADDSDTVEGEAGIDRLLFIGAGFNEEFDISANGERARVFRDVDGATVDLGGVETIELHVLGGADFVNIDDLSATEVAKVEIDLAAAGGGADGVLDHIFFNTSAGADSMTVGLAGGVVSVNGAATDLDISNWDSAVDVVTINALDGDDTFDASGLPAGTIQYLFHGGTGNDEATGGASSEQLSGELGDDILDGGSEVDALDGGDGNDVLIGGDGEDFLSGGAGDDRMIWNPGDDSDRFEGGDGLDTAELNGADAAETFAIAPNGSRVVFERLNPAPVTLDIINTEGLVLEAKGGGDIITAANGLAGLISLTLDGGDGNDTITSGDGDDLLKGRDGSDTIAGGAGDDVASLGAGNDLFVWNVGDGNDTIEGEAGSDAFQFNGADINENFDIAANGGHARLLRSGGFSQDLAGIETIDLRVLGGSDFIVVHDLSATDVDKVKLALAASGGGDDGAGDQIFAEATAGADDIVVTRAGGVVKIDGLAAAIEISSFDELLDSLTIRGFDGNDTIDASGLTVGLTIDGGAGNDLVTGSQADDSVTGGIGDDHIVDTDLLNLDAYSGGSGIDTIDYGSVALANGTVTINLATGQIVQAGGSSDTIALFENAIGSQGGETILGTFGANVLDGNGGSDTIDGRDGDDTIKGGNGSDSLDGGTGVDSLSGGAGNDNYFVDNGADKVLEAAGGGSDRIFAGVSFALASGQEVETLSTSDVAGTTAINLTGNSFDNVLIGNRGANILDGKAGADTMKGGDGNDTYLVDDAGDLATELAGQGNDTVEAKVSYTIAGNIESLALKGAGNINGTGNGLANQIVGNAGNNVVAGKNGNDILTGGTGADSFLFDTALSATTNMDTVADFDAPNDTIRLDRDVFTAFTTTGTLAAGAFRIGAAAQDTDDRILYDAATGDLLYDRDGTGAAAAVQFAHLDSIPVLGNADFRIVA